MRSRSRRDAASSASLAADCGEPLAVAMPDELTDEVLAAPLDRAAVEEEEVEDEEEVEEDELSPSTKPEDDDGLEGDDGLLLLLLALVLMAFESLMPLESDGDERRGGRRFPPRPPRVGGCRPLPPRVEPEVVEVGVKSPSALETPVDEALGAGVAEPPEPEGECVAESVGSKRSSSTDSSALEAAASEADELAAEAEPPRERIPPRPPRRLGVGLLSRLMGLVSSLALELECDGVVALLVPEAAAAAPSEAELMDGVEAGDETAAATAAEDCDGDEISSSMASGLLSPSHSGESEVRERADLDCVGVPIERLRFIPPRLEAEPRPAKSDSSSV